MAFPAGAALFLVGAGVLLRAAAFLPWGLASCTGAYAAGLLASSAGIDLLSPLFAAGLLLAAELAYWSVEERTGRETIEVLARRLGVVLLLALGTALVGSLLLAAAQARPVGGPAVLALGVAAAVGILALLARLARAPGR